MDANKHEHNRKSKMKRLMTHETQLELKYLDYADEYEVVRLAWHAVHGGYFIAHDRRTYKTINGANKYFDSLLVKYNMEEEK